MRTFEIAKRLASAAQEGRLVSAVRKRLAEHAREYVYRVALGLRYHRSDTLPLVLIHGDFSADPVGILLKQSLERAINNIGSLPDFVRSIEGMSGQKYRTFINDFISSHQNPRYLEIGSWAGSTATAALYGNSVTALCIDNWSEFGGPREAFFDNIKCALSPDVNFQFVEKDFRDVDYTSLGRFNIYLFDGPHEEKDQYDGIMIARPALDKICVLIVDDWNWRKVRLGTFRAVRDSGYRIAVAVEIRTTLNNGHPVISCWR